MHVLRRLYGVAIRWFGAREPAVLFALLLVVGGGWAFIKTADEVIEGETNHFDKWVVQSLRRPDNPAVPIGPAWLAEIGRDATAFGGIAALTFFTAAVSGFLWLDRKYRMLGFLLAATASGLLVSLLLKRLFQRPRPEVVPHLSYVYTTSFPSGHSLLSTVVYLTLGVLVASVVPRWPVKIYVVSLAVLLCVMVGASRVFLGVHYPTDVLAGWTAGLTWALLCWLAARSLQRRGQLETEADRPADVDHAPSNVTVDAAPAGPG